MTIMSFIDVLLVSFIFLSGSYSLFIFLTSKELNGIVYKEVVSKEGCEQRFPSNTKPECFVYNEEGSAMGKEQNGFTAFFPNLQHPIAGSSSPPEQITISYSQQSKNLYNQE